jgi:hypothetical protein
LIERNATVPLRELKPAIGFAASLLAVACQILLLATISLAPLGITSDPLGGVPICHHSTDDTTQPARQTPDRHVHDCALCAVCLAHTWQLALLSPPPTLPHQHSVAAVRPDADRPRTPPVRLVAAAQPRGPPSLI